MLQRGLAGWGNTRWLRNPPADLFRVLFGGMLMGIVGASPVLVWTEPISAEVLTRMTPGGDAIELVIPTEIGPQKDIIPLYRGGNIPYFSAGIGQAEREAVYPAFSLKLVFTAGGKPFVVGAGVVIRNSDGATVLTVPQEQVIGPWLFIDLPDGTYDVEATLGGHIQQVRGIKVRRGQVTTQHVRWAEDRSPALSVQAE
ncbi:MAG: carboxypeptidase-like regulatory domain-containing protein [Nitrospira sp.]|nr:hypothetical protein [Nitrospira sp.]